MSFYIELQIWQFMWSVSRKTAAVIKDKSVDQNKGSDGLTDGNQGYEEDEYEDVDKTIFDDLVDIFNFRSSKRGRWDVQYFCVVSSA